MIDKACHACRKENVYKEFFWNKQWGHAPGYTGQPPAQYSRRIEDTYICRNCSHIFRHYFGDVNEYHKEVYRRLGEEGQEIYPEMERAHYVGNFLTKSKPYLNKQQTMLEIGSGDAMFARLAKEYIKSITCCEIDEKMAKICTDLGFTTINKNILDFESKKHKYDVVVAMDVLEHILDLQAFVRKMEQIVNKYFIFQIPALRTMVPPNPTFDGHSHYFSPSSIVKLFEEKFESRIALLASPGTLARGTEYFVLLKKR